MMIDLLEKNAFSERLCPVCNAEEFIPLFTDINRREALPVSATLAECQSCGMHYINPAPDAASLLQLYCNGIVDPVTVNLPDVQPVSRIRPERTFSRRFARSINGLLRGHPHDWPEEDGKGRSILDFGCYDGAKLTYWYQRGWQVAGIDLNEQAVQVAKCRFPDGQFWCGDLLHLEIKDRFDYIRADNVVEHLLDPVAYLDALVKLLKPKGQLRIFVPNGAALSVRLFERYSAVYWVPFHLNLFTLHTLSRLLNQVGLKNVTCTTFTPNGSWTWTQRQLLLQPGFDRRRPSFIDCIIRWMRVINYPGEALAQWLGVGEELIGTGQCPSEK